MELTTYRKIYDQDLFNEEFNYTEKPIPNVNSSKKFKKSKYLKRYLPITDWLAKYSIKSDLLADLISGLTVAVMHIPQGMGYALLGNVPPIVGIYMAFFPVLFYFILGTSRHNSMGTLAIITIMVGKIVEYHSTIQAPVTENEMHILTNDSSIINEIAFGDDVNGFDVGGIGLDKYTPVEVATAVCFVVGVVQIIMFLFRFGAISSLLSDSLISGLTTGGAIHILTSQVKDVFGIKIKSYNGIFELLYTYIDIVKEIHTINWVTFGVSLTTMILLILNNEVLKPLAAKRCSFPIPGEIILVLLATLVSTWCSLDQYSVKAIGHIPTGFPEPNVPNMDLAGSIIIECLPIAVISFTFTISMAITFARKNNYEVYANQELLAMGAGNIFGSFFSCMPFSASLSRSVIQEKVGGKTQMTSLVSCAILAVILLWIGPFFEPLPRSVLAGIIIVSLKGMLWQFKDLFKFWNDSKIDGCVWLITLFAVVMLGIDIGLIVGIALSLLCIFVNSLKPHVYLLGNIPKTDIYLDLSRYKNAKELLYIKIYHYNGSINFACKNFFRSKLCHLLNVDISKALRRYKKGKMIDIDFKLIIWDMSGLNYIDGSGVEFLKSLIKDLKEIEIDVYIASLSCFSYDEFSRHGLTKADFGVQMFPTIHDAVQYAQINNFQHLLKTEHLI